MDAKRERFEAKAVAIRGNDIDTDRIIPARFLKCVVFEGLGEHAFEDDRAQLQAQGKLHPMDQPHYADARIMLVNKNFGCGSSREHAPQAIMRWHKGIQALVGESFAEIFFGNCVALGIPCVTVSAEAIQALMDANEKNPSAQVNVDLVNQTVELGELRYPLSMPEGARKQLIEGRWDSTLELLSNQEKIAHTAQQLPYFNL